MRYVFSSLARFSAVEFDAFPDTYIYVAVARRPEVAPGNYSLSLTIVGGMSSLVVIAA